ncbi:MULTISPECIES: type II toxin-antitoxin system HipA family toxin [unclassified Neptuniibacter]|uniref:type II toxin-antitoxin system HipA family toxin n=1 Tax=unclassified Neptuniibacter TaxID=2630693 RepID=UPI0025E512DB|nr:MULTISPECIES: type II toxin-antitoxin system HipA family toxin [unclassified Neptuniibacter]|tara:strand:- start:878 stop:2158 length:1281 start_codon:yes stop_codon:yes gene_type:complete
MDVTVKVSMWGALVGAVTFENGIGSFQYSQEWIDTGLEISPLKMPLSSQVYRFPELIRTKSFNGLCGLVADSLPEKFGNKILSQYLAKQGRSFDDMSAGERLCYLGSRGMGALEYTPDYGEEDLTESIPIDIHELVDVAQKVLSKANTDKANIKDDGLEALVQIGTSAGGAKAKAVIAWNEETGEVRSGQGEAPKGFTHWLIKFDEIENEELATAHQIGRIEYAYHLMALDAGIDMERCELMEDENKAHFMTQRFDRSDTGDKFHVQTFCGIAHADRDPPGQIGYESLFTTIRQLGLGQEALNEMFRRMVFNICARNQGDHTKNHAFMMDAEGEWYLTPAYDLCFSYKPGNKFIETHQMSCNGKRDNFVLSDLLEAAASADIKNPQKIINEVQAATYKWKEFSKEAGLSSKEIDAIGKLFRRFKVS